MTTEKKVARRKHLVGLWVVLMLCQRHGSGLVMIVVCRRPAQYL
jgi:hypothetical protein